jgi:hypothetical protein
MRVHGPVRYLLPLLLIISGCAAGGPTAPTPGPSSRVRPPDPTLQAVADTWWPRQAACVGAPENSLGVGYPVDVVEESFQCGGVEAAGCFHYTRISVVRRWFESALSHEFIHLALWKTGRDIGHANPAFAQCDVLNYVGSATRALLYRDGAAWGEVQ